MGTDVVGGVGDGVLLEATVFGLVGADGAGLGFEVGAGAEVLRDAVEFVGIVTEVRGGDVDATLEALVDVMPLGTKKGF